MVSFFNKKYLIKLLFLCFIFSFFGYFSQVESEGYINSSVPDYINLPVNQGSFKNTGPITIKDVVRVHAVNYIKLNFKFSTNDPSFSYGNIFQTADTSDALRMEFQPPNSLILFLGDAKPFVVSKSIQPDKDYSIKLDFEKNKQLKVWVDSQEIFNVLDPNVLSGKIDLSKVLIGTGFDRQRVMRGSVRDCNFDVGYTYTSTFCFISKVLFFLLCGITFIIRIYLKFSVRGGGSAKVNNEAIDPIVLMVFISGFCILTLALSLMAIKFIGQSYLGLSKWISVLVLPFSVVFYIFLDGFLIKNRVAADLLAVPLFVYLSGLIGLGLAKEINNLNIFILSLVAFSCVSVCLTNGISLSDIRLNNLKHFFLKITLPLFFVVASWVALFDLTNWTAFLDLMQSNFVVGCIGSFIILYAVLHFVCLEPSHDQLTITKNKMMKSGPKLINKSLFDGLVVIVFLCLSFRHDSLFIPGSEYHWEYFHGVVEGVRNGGWLLWDTPSQYGFLNILIASVVPVTSSWQAIYIFQGTLLFLVSLGIYFISLHYNREFTFNRLFVFLIVFSSLFYADPVFIGPFPFPSSSVVRFFCVYLMIFSVFLFPRVGSRQIFFLSFTWVLAVLWSAESALYGTTILVFVLSAMCLSRIPLRKLFKYVGVPLALLFSSLLFVVLVYRFRLGVLPDVFCFFEHAVGYAGGFGYVPFPLFGPANILLMLFLATITSCIFLIKNDKNSILITPLAAIAGTLVAISSYYIGRPVPQNITAIIPIISMVLILTIIAVRKLDSWSILINVVSVPFLFLVLVPMINPIWYKTLLSFEAFSSDIVRKLPKADAELSSIIYETNPKIGSKYIYYGDDAVAPIFENNYSFLNDSNWLPVPLQLLEVPISETRRNLYLNRYICRKQPSNGVLISRDGDQIEPRKQVFLDELNKYYIVSLIAKGNSYSLYSFNKINLNLCKATLKASL